MSDAMSVSGEPNSWADPRLRTIRTNFDWVLHTVDSIRATLDSYAADRFGVEDDLRQHDPQMAGLLERIVAVYGEPPSM
jgi:hypothetical protein